MVRSELRDLRGRAAAVIYILGGAGFVGSAYARLLDELGEPFTVVNRANYAELRGSACRVLINANGNSKKFMATRDPLWDFDASVRSVAASLEDFRAERYVFLSSGDVYPDPSSAEATREDGAIDLSRISRYGLHKYLAEQVVRAAHPDWLVVRMGGFVGPGLRKNAVFDMLCGDPVWLSPESELQFISTDAAARLVWGLVHAGVRREVVNLGAEGLLNLGAFHRAVGSASEFRAGAPPVRYELSLARLRGLSAGPLPRTEACVHDFAASVQAGRIVLKEKVAAC
jgi:nucleoside-diphosphate-sugar epimerase